jgi:hypothetical protein
MQTAVTFPTLAPQQGQSIQELVALLAAQGSHATVPLLSLATRTALTTSAVQLNQCYTALILHLYVSAASGTGGLAMKIGCQPPNPGAPYDTTISSPNSTLITSAGVYEMIIHPATTGYLTGSPFRFPAILPIQWAATVTHGDASNYTYSLYATLFRA